MKDTESVTTYSMSIAAGTADTLSFMHGMDGEFRLTKAEFLSDETVAADASNNAKVELQQSGTALGSFDTDSGGGNDSLTEGDEVDITLTGGTSLEFGANDAMSIVKTENGTGAAAKGMWIFRWEHLRV